MIHNELINPADTRGKIRFPFTLLVMSLILLVGFFYKTVIFGLIPFPGDTLISEYKPWRTQSYLGYSPGSYPNKAQYPDTLRQIYPWKTLVISEIKQGRIPLWNPYNFSGTPLLANFQSAAFYPLSGLYFLLDQVTAWTILIMLQPLLAFIFTFAYSRKIGLSSGGSYLTALAYGFSHFMTVWLEYNTIGHVILNLPLLLLAAQHLSERRSWFWITVSVASVSASLLAGHPQVFLYQIVFFIFYVLTVISGRTARIITLTTVVLGTGIAGIQLLPGVELMINAARSSHEYGIMTDKILIQPWHLIMGFIPDFFGSPVTRNYTLPDTYIGKVMSVGLAALFLAIIGLKDAVRKQPFRFFIFSGITILIFVTKNPLTMLFYRFNIPFFSSSNPTLAMFLLSFSAAVLAGQGFDAWIQNRIPLKRVGIFLAVTGIAAILLNFMVFAPADFFPNIARYLSSAKRNLLFGTGLTAALFTVLIAGKKLKRKSVPVILILMLQTGELWYNFTKFNPFVPRELVFPKTEIFQELIKINGYDRVWGLGSAYIEPNFATQTGLYMPDGYDPLYPKRYGQFIQGNTDGKVTSGFNAATRSDANIYADTGNFAVNTNRLKILDLLGVRFILDRTENGSSDTTLPGRRFSRLFSVNDWIIYENLQAAGRVFFAKEILGYDTPEKFQTIFFDPAFDVSRSVLISGGSTSDGSEGNAVITDYTPTEITITTENKSDGIVFLSDTYYPGWLAYIDGRKTPILQANYAFRAVDVPAGNHTVKFKYLPLSFRIGAIITLISTVSAIIIVAYSARKHI